MPDSAERRWESDVLLSDGRPVRLRPARPGDGEALRRFHAGLSGETIYMRYFSPKPRLSRRLMERFTHCDAARHLVLFAWSSDDIIAMASYDRYQETDAAEVTFCVGDSHQGLGLGTLLLEHLAAIAREHGYRRFVADTLPHNEPMLHVFESSGLHAHRTLRHGVVHLEFPLDPTDEAIARVERREHLSESISVARLLAPQSIAVVGAGRAPGGLGHDILRNLRAGGFRGRLYPVHPRAAEVAGMRAWPTLAEVPDDVDLVIVAVPAARVLDVARAAADKRSRGLVVISAGFSESGPEGAERERELVALARRRGMRVIGPNCMGVVNTAPEVRMNATFAPAAPAPGRIGLSSQSGALGMAILERSRDLGLGISSFVSVGNKADISANDLLQFWEDDTGTDLVLLYLESFGNPRKFSRIARRLSRRKPILAVKGGRSASGRRGAARHAAAPPAAEAAVEALFRQTGVIRVDTLEQLFETALVLAHQPLPRGRRVAIVGNAGGPGVLAADACEGAGLRVPELGAGARERLSERVPDAAALENPVDLAGAPADYETAISAVLADPGIDAAIAIFAPPRATDPTGVVRAIARAAAQAGGAKPVLASFVARPGGVLDGSGPPGGGHCIPCFPFPESAAQALARACEYAEWRARPAGRAPSFPGQYAECARDAARRALEGGRRVELPAAGELLAAYGIEVARAERVGSAEAAATAAREIGFPVALKGVGGVRLGLESESAVRGAFGAIGGPGSLVQEMVEGGVEVAVGIVHDPSFGPLVALGLAGLATDLLGARSHRVLPLTDLDASELVRAIRGAPLLFGYRGAPPVDTAALEGLLLRVGRLAEEVSEVAALELDPVCVSHKRAVVLRAEAHLAPLAPEPDLAVRRLA